MDRLDKILVSQGIAGRKEARELIKKGEVLVNGEPVKKPEYKFEPENCDITVKGQGLVYRKNIYIMLNKPSGVVSAVKDNLDTTVIDILPEEYRRKGLFPAGRLDKDTEGLLIITDDGEFAHKILSPKNHVEKRYIAELDKEIDGNVIKNFENGIVFADGTKCMPAKLKIIPESQNKKGLVTICEGKFHQVKKMFSVCGINVVHLKRISIGNLYLDSNLPIGSCKLMSKLDIESIYIGKLH